MDAPRTRSAELRRFLAELEDHPELLASLNERGLSDPELEDLVLRVKDPAELATWLETAAEAEE